MNKNDLRYILSPGTGVLKRDMKLYNQIYATWHRLWSETLHSLNVTHPLHSECFTRQDYFGSLFYKDKCIALCSFRWSNAEELGFLGDSYFNNWTRPAIQQLKLEGDSIIVCGNFCLDPEFRGNAFGFSGKDLLMGLIVQTFMNSQANCLAGAVRINRKMNDVTLRWGAKLIAQDLDSGYGDAKIDLIGFFRSQVEKSNPPDLAQTAEELWENRLVLSRQLVTFPNRAKKFTPVRKAA